MVLSTIELFCGTGNREAGGGAGGVTSDCSVTNVTKSCSCNLLDRGVDNV